MTKEQLRKQYQSARLSLQQNDLEAFIQALIRLFLQHVSLDQVKIAHVYLPIEKNNEPDTWQFVKVFQERQIAISIPKVMGNELVHQYFNSNGQLTANQWGIMEPTAGTPTQVEDIDLVIVPLLAFDRQLQRVGYGKGYYDRFLGLCKTSCQKVGLSFFEPVDAISDVAPTDVALDCVVTPERVYRKTC